MRTYNIHTYSHAIDPNDNVSHELLLLVFEAVAVHIVLLVFEKHRSPNSLGGSDGGKNESER